MHVVFCFIKTEALKQNFNSQVISLVYNAQSDGKLD